MHFHHIGVFQDESNGNGDDVECHSVSYESECNEIPFYEMVKIVERDVFGTSEGDENEECEDETIKSR